MICNVAKFRENGSAGYNLQPVWQPPMQAPNEDADLSSVLGSMGAMQVRYARCLCRMHTYCISFALSVLSLSLSLALSHSRACVVVVDMCVGCDGPVLLAATD